MSLTEMSANKCFGGKQGVYSHKSSATDTDMTFAVYEPPQAADGPVPVLWYLSGLTCTHENAMVKAGAQAIASQRGVMLVFPDTSPRGEGVPDDPDGAYDFGLGAGFYVNATEAPWNANYHMADYVAEELPALIAANFPADMARQGITGHSMGGHGALTTALRHPGRFKSVSAFSPIVSPMNCPWGHKALGGYIGDNRDNWRAYDACALIADATERLPILVDQGDADNFLDEQLKSYLLQEACDKAGHPLTLRLQPGYDHSYFFIASFMADHVTWHADALT
ncbi:MAG: S-formylglutathione hydrolase [Hyphomicrobiales bacterium]|nr:S-formylglutathione hydrolase [Hyphomicrobiales bacterium]